MQRVMTAFEVRMRARFATGGRLEEGLGLYGPAMVQFREEEEEEFHLGWIGCQFGKETFFGRF